LMSIYTIVAQGVFIVERADMANFVNGIIQNESINTRSNKQQLCP